MLFLFRSHGGSLMADASNHKRTPRDVAQLASAYLARTMGNAVLALPKCGNKHT